MPQGVTLRQIDGGANYYTSNGYTYAASFPTSLSGGWDNPGFIPIGSFLGNLSSDNVSYWLELGWTSGFTIDGASSYTVARSNNISVIANYGNTGITDSPGAETVAFDADDEPSTYDNYSAGNVCEGIQTEPNAMQAGRFWMLNNTWNQIQYGGVNGTPGDGSLAAMFFTPVKTPSGATKTFGAGSDDFYFFAGAYGDTAGYYGGTLYNVSTNSGNLTPDQLRRGFLYGDYIDSQRALLGTNSDGSGKIPLWSLVETGGPYTQNTVASSYIQPAELNQAVWMSFIHGARGLIYFDHSFAGPEQSDNNMFDSYYAAASNFPNTGGYANPGGISMYAQVKQTDQLVHQLAAIINSPFAINYVSVTPAAVTCLLPCQVDGSTVFSTVGIDVMAKWYTGGGAYSNGAYIFASPRASETAQNISATFTIADQNATSVTVINEGRTISINSKHQFVDNFATGLTVHIYQVQ